MFTITLELTREEATDLEDIIDDNVDSAIDAKRDVDEEERASLDAYIDELRSIQHRLQAKLK